MNGNSKEKQEEGQEETETDKNIVDMKKETDMEERRGEDAMREWAGILKREVTVTAEGRKGIITQRMRTA